MLVHEIMLSISVRPVLTSRISGQCCANTGLFISGNGQQVLEEQRSSVGKLKLISQPTVVNYCTQIICAAFCISIIHKIVKNVILRAIGTVEPQ